MSILLSAVFKIFLKLLWQHKTIRNVGLFQTTQIKLKEFLKWHVHKLFRWFYYLTVEAFQQKLCCPRCVPKSGKPVYFQLCINIIAEPIIYYSFSVTYCLQQKTCLINWVWVCLSEQLNFNGANSSVLDPNVNSMTASKLVSNL